MRVRVLHARVLIIFDIMFIGHIRQRLSLQFQSKKGKKYFPFCVKRKLIAILLRALGIEGEYERSEYV